MKKHEVFDARYAMLLTELSRYSYVHMKARFYSSQTRNSELDYTINKVIKRALNGYSFFESLGSLEVITSKELRRRGFKVEGSAVYNYYIIRW